MIAPDDEVPVEEDDSEEDVEEAWVCWGELLSELLCLRKFSSTLAVEDVSTQLEDDVGVGTAVLTAEDEKSEEAEDDELLEGATSQRLWRLRMGCAETALTTAKRATRDLAKSIVIVGGVKLVEMQQRRDLSTKDGI